MHDILQPWELLFARRVKKLCAVKAGDSQWVQIPPGDGSLQPEAIGAAGAAQCFESGTTVPEESSLTTI